MSDVPLLRGRGPTARERAAGIAVVALLALGGFYQGFAPQVGGGTRYQSAQVDPNAPRAVVLPPGQTIPIGLETPEAQQLAAEVRPAPAHRRPPASPEPSIVVAEAPPPAMSAADAGTDVVAVEPVEAAPPIQADQLITPTAPERLQ